MDGQRKAYIRMMYKAKKPLKTVVTIVSGIFLTKGHNQVNSILKTMSNIMPIKIAASIVAQAGYPMA